MPIKIEKDAISGRETTGQVWDGVRELNTPIPRWWLYTFIATCIWSVGYVVVYPSVPGLFRYYHGAIGYSTRVEVNSQVASIAAIRARSMDRIESSPFAQIASDPKLMAVAMAAGKITFANNCQPCHGAGGGGRPGFPTLASDSWIWGGKLEDIQASVNHGIRSEDPDARVSQMPRFGVDGLLKPVEIAAVADYVLALRGANKDGTDVIAGGKLYAENCVACHGEKGEGKREVGAPNLRSAVNLYGTSKDAIIAQISVPRQGVMPSWNARLDAATIKSVAIYVHSLGGGE